MSVWRLIYSDYRRYRVGSNAGWFGVVFLTQGFWATTLHRLSHRALRVSGVPLLGLCVKVFIALSCKFMEILTGILIKPECEIGQGFQIAHFGPTLVGALQIGDNCSLSHVVTIGKGGRGERYGNPVIGNRVHVGSNVVIVGNITIGDDAVICAGAVVSNSIPPRGVAIGNPARVVGYDGSFDLIKYDGMETDPDRCASLANVPPGPIRREEK